MLNIGFLVFVTETPPQPPKHLLLISLNYLAASAALSVHRRRQSKTGRRPLRRRTVNRPHLADSGHPTPSGCSLSPPLPPALLTSLLDKPRGSWSASESPRLLFRPTRPTTATDHHFTPPCTESFAGAPSTVSQKPGTSRFFSGENKLTNTCGWTG